MISLQAERVLIVSVLMVGIPIDAG